MCVCALYCGKNISICICGRVFRLQIGGSPMSRYTGRRTCAQCLRRIMMATDEVLEHATMRMWPVAQDECILQTYTYSIIPLSY